MAAPARRRSELAHDRGVTRLAVVETRREVGQELSEWVAGRDLVVVTAPPVWRLHGEATVGALESAARSFRVLEVPDGEAAKTLSVAQDLWQGMLAAGARRDSLLLTFGGGSVCDLGAFVASTFMRGIDFGHVPTTLLAQVDASIGGKSAVNLATAKNVIGVFQHPERVVAATDLLQTLPPRQLRAGLVEVVKVAVVCEPGLFETLEGTLGEVLGEHSAAWPDIVVAAQRAKVAVVNRDPREEGERRVLNFGHTLGHALEVNLDYGTLAHGEAVAYGILFALRLASSRGLDAGCRRRVEAMLGRLELPPLPPLPVEGLLGALGRDKKAGPKGVVWVLPTGFGAWEAVVLEPAFVETELRAFMAQHSSAC